MLLPERGKDEKSVGTAFKSVNTKYIAMENENNRRKTPGLPDTTQKKAGTTSAFSAASDEQNVEQNEARKKYLEDGEQGRASFVSGTTSHGGSNYGQGSSSLGPSSYKQGSQRSRGANYDNEVGKFSETGTQGSGYEAMTGNVSNDIRKQGGTDAEHDEFGDEKDDTIGIP